MKKRQFLTLTSTLIFLISSACSTASKKHEVVSGPKRIIDVHSHTFLIGETGGYFEKHPGDVKSAYLKDRNEAGVFTSIAHTSNINQGYIDMKNDRVFHCAGVRPPIDKAGLENGLKSGKFKCIKIYLGYVPLYATDPVYDPVYRLAEKYEIPVVYHTGDVFDPDARVKFADPLLIDDVAVKHRKINFVIAHCGNPWIDTAAELAYKNENVYLDGSAFLIGDLDKMTDEKIQEAMVKPLKWIFNYVENPHKLMFGTDWPLTKTSSYIKPFKAAIPPEYWDDVFYNNAAKVFKIKD
jgi:predicted TIM-barrel fold metal-dependent hydrolase